MSSPTTPPPVVSVVYEVHATYVSGKSSGMSVIHVAATDAGTALSKATAYFTGLGYTNLLFQSVTTVWPLDVP